MRLLSKVWLWTAALLALGACGGDGNGTGPTAGTTRPEGQLTFLQPGADAPDIANPVIEFDAVRGQDSEVFMYYHRRADRPDSTEFLRFRVDGRSLDRRPDGSAIADGESVRITITLVDPARLIVQFQPSGLRFVAGRPAELRIKYLEADDDVDDSTRRQFSIWRQETSTGPWESQPSTVLLSTSEVETVVTGFSNYAIAY